MSICLITERRATRFTGSNGVHRVSKVLRGLGVSYKRGPSFWLENEADLEFILSDFKRSARAAKRKLHPDARGDTAQFAALSAASDFVLRAFARHGVGERVSARALERENKDKSVREKARARFSRKKTNQTTAKTQQP